MLILSIDTSCDETAVAIGQGRKILANEVYSQILLHQQWGGVVPSIAKKAHEEKIDLVLETCLKKFYRGRGALFSSQLKKDFFAACFRQINYIAVTQGPGLAIALEVGIKKAKELAEKYHKKLLAINHLEGHIYSVFAQNSQGNPSHKIEFPLLAVIVSGGHTELILMKKHLHYEILGSTLDDAVGEALDKAAKTLGLGYPGGPIIEKLSQEVKNVDTYHFPRPMWQDQSLNFSYSGLKTAFYYYLRHLNEAEKNQQLKQLASSFQEAAFAVLIKKTQTAIKQTKVKTIVVGGGVIANKRLRLLLRLMAKKNNLKLIFPPYYYLVGDNAAMIAVAAYFHARQHRFISDINKLDRLPRMSL